MTNSKYGIFVHALHKSASMFLYKIFKDLSEEANISYYSVNHKPVPNHDDFQQDINKSFCYCPVRHFAISLDRVPQRMKSMTPEFLIQDNFPNIPNIYRIYQTRDPRDILVSQYFSFGFIHSGKTNITASKQRIQKMTIDEYCIEEADDLWNKYQDIMKVTSSGKTNYLLVKYETMVLNFQEWLSQVIKVFEFDNYEQIWEKYYQKYQHEFDTENFEEGMRHKRKMIPGDYQEKLEPSTIEILNSKFGDILSQLYGIKEEAKI